MKVAYYCSNNPQSILALDVITSRGYTVESVFCSDNSISNVLYDKCKKLNIPDVCSVNSKQILNKKYDLLISFSYHKLIKREEIASAKIAINFHPAPLPKYRGLGTNMWAIINNETEWGATCHYIDENYDTGKIIECRKFPIDKNAIKTGVDLSSASWDVCIGLLSDILDRIINGETLSGKEQIKEEGKTYTRKDLEKAKCIDLNEEPSLIIRKIDALWYPPYKGAYTMINNQKVYLLTEDLLEELFKRSNKK